MTKTFALLTILLLFNMQSVLAQRGRSIDAMQRVKQKRCSEICASFRRGIRCSATSTRRNYYAPHPGHTSVPDFMKFYNDPYTLLRMISRMV